MLKIVEAMRLSSQSSLTNLRVTVQLPPGLELSTQPDVLPTVLFPEDTFSVCLIISGQVGPTYAHSCNDRYSRSALCNTSSCPVLISIVLIKFLKSMFSNLLSIHNHNNKNSNGGCLTSASQWRSYWMVQIPIEVFETESTKSYFWQGNMRMTRVMLII